jgi:hypothetical protein
LLQRGGRGNRHGILQDAAGPLLVAAAERRERQNERHEE